MEPLYKFTSIFLDSFSGLMPFFLLGLISSAMVEVFLDSQKIKIFSRGWGWVKTLLFLALTAVLLPVAKGGILPLARRLQQKGMPLYMVLFFLTAAPVVNFLTIDNSAVAFGWGSLVWMRFGLGWMLALLTALVFSQVVVEPQAANGAGINFAEPENTSRWNRFIRTVLSDCFAWLPYFIAGSLAATVLRVALPLADWMNAAGGTPAQIALAMGYGSVLSISSVVDCFVVLNWLGRFPLAVILAFLMAGSIVDVRGLVMMVKGFGIKTSLYWAVFVLVLVFISTMVIQLGFRG